MRTKHILTAMVLPALFAACTADEFTENGSNANLADRALLAPITFTVENGADTRFAWNEEGNGNWTWENTDAFSAFLVDNGGSDPDEWKPKDYLRTNYVYESKDGGSTYETTSNMVEGLYWFYAPARQGEGVESTQLMDFELATSQDAEYYKSDAAKVFFTGLYKLVAGDEPQNLPLSLTNFYSRAEFPLVNNTDEAITIRQIVLEADDPFVVKGKISTEKLEKYMYAFNEAGELVPAVNLNDKTDDDMTLDELKEQLQKANNIVKDGETSDFIMLNLGDGVTLAKGARQSFTMLVPCTDKNVACTIRIITDKGVVIIDKNSESNYVKNTQFVHNGLKPMFGFEGDQKTFKAFSINEKSLEDLGGAYYAGSYEDMMSLINTVNGNISVYNIGDWKLDAAMATAITNSDSYVSFQEPMTIESKEAVKLTEVSFTNVTVAKGTTVSFNAADNNDDKCAVSGTMTIEEGATVELNAGDFSKAVVENKGSLTVSESAETRTGSGSGQKDLTIESTGAVKFVDQNKYLLTVNGGSVEYATAKTTPTTTYQTHDGKLNLPTGADLKNNIKIIVDKNVIVNIGKGLTADSYQDPTTKAVYSVDIVNNGEITIGGSYTLTTNGDLTNNGEISVTGTLNINGTATNAADATIDKSTIGEDAVVTNSGTMSDVTNNGKITTVAGSHTAIAGGTGTIDNTAKTDVSGTLTNQTVAYVISEALNDKAIEDLGIATLNGVYKVNKLIFKNAVRVEAGAVEIPAAITAVDFEDGSSVYVGGENSSKLTFAGVVTTNINGNVTFEGFNADATIEFSQTASDMKVVVAEGKTLTIETGKVSGNSIKKLAFESEDDPDNKIAGGKEVSFRK